MKQHQSIRTPFFLLVGLIILAITLALAYLRIGPLRPAAVSEFDGSKAMEFAAAQMEFGSRITGSAGNQLAGDYVASQLRAAGWAVAYETFSYQGVAVRNIIGRANIGRGPVVILGAHYDTRRRADQDKAHPQGPVPGANDGASGVAVLLELARALDLSRVPNEVWLAFFDAEDNGDLDGWDWIVGSSYMAEHLTVQPEAVIVVDMVGDSDQQIYMDQNSSMALSAQIWATAAQLGYSDHFVPVPHWAMLDDHTPFAARGIPAVDIIDFDYPYWHTTEDTLDKLSADSLERVGRTLKAFLEGKAQP